MKTFTLIKPSSALATSVVLVVHLLIGSCVHAGEFFVGINAGTATFDGLNDACDEVLENEAFIGGFSVGCQVTSDSDTAFSINGGYNFNRIFGLEAGYVDLGEYSANISAAGITVDAAAEVDYIYAAVVLTAPISKKFSVSARLGGVNADIAVSSQIGLGAELEDAPAGFAGVSLDYRIAEKVSFQVRYDSLSEADITTVGLRYHF